MQQHSVLSGELTLNYKMNGAGSFNLFEISGTQAGEYRKILGVREREPRKSLKGRVRSSYFYIHPRAPSDDTAKGRRLGLLFPPGAGSLQSLHCNPTSCTFLGREEREEEKEEAVAS